MSVTNPFTTGSFKLNLDVNSWLDQYIGSKGVTLADFLIDFVIAMLILLIGFRLVKYIVKMIDAIFEKSNMDITLRTFLRSVINIGLKILVIFLAVSRLGVAASTIVALIGSATFAVGMSLQGSLGNIAGGVILLFVKPFVVGDYIYEESSGKEGRVQAIGIMYTSLLTIDNKAVMIPNGNLSGSSITNYTHQDKRLVELKVGIRYDEDIKKVRQILEKVLEEEEYHLKAQEPRIFVNEFKDSCIEIGIRFWVATDNYWDARWSALENIKEGFDREGIEIPFNQLDVHMIPAAADQ